MSAESATPLDAVVDGYLSYAITINMKVGGTLGNETSIVVESSAPAVAKRAPEVPFGLLALDTGAHLNVLAYLQPNWVQWGGERERERMRREEEWPNIGRPHLRLETIHNPTTPFVLSFAVGGTFRVDQARRGLSRRKYPLWAKEI